MKIYYVFVFSNDQEATPAQEPKSMASFNELGIPFPLFEAPVIEAGGYVGLATCALCSGEDRHCFRLDTIILSCPDCGVQNARSARPFRGLMGDFACCSCRCDVIVPDNLKVEGGPAICYACFRSGLGADTKDTEYGQVDVEAAERGFAQSHPHLDDCPFDLVGDKPFDEYNPMDNWFSACIPRPEMWELLRTPGFLGWQGLKWLFCCQRLMTYVGNWKNFIDSRHRPEDARAFFDALVAAEDETESSKDEHLWRAVQDRSCEMYVFLCRDCQCYRGYWDCC